MKILISADMEGTCGVSSWTQVTPPEYGEAGSSGVEYERARLRMTREVNAAIEGALDGGASEVIVNDSHDGMRNLIPEELDPRCRFITWMASADSFTPAITPKPAPRTRPSPTPGPAG